MKISTYHKSVINVYQWFHRSIFPESIIKSSSTKYTTGTIHMKNNINSKSTLASICALILSAWSWIRHSTFVEYQINSVPESQFIKFLQAYFTVLAALMKAILCWAFLQTHPAHLFPNRDDEPFYWRIVELD